MGKHLKGLWELRTKLKDEAKNMTRDKKKTDQIKDPRGVNLCEFSVSIDGP